MFATTLKTVGTAVFAGLATYGVIRTGEYIYDNHTDAGKKEAQERKEEHERSIKKSKLALALLQKANDAVEGLEEMKAATKPTTIALPSAEIMQAFTAMQNQIAALTAQAAQAAQAQAVPSGNSGVPSRKGG